MINAEGRFAAPCFYVTQGCMILFHPRRSVMRQFRAGFVAPPCRHLRAANFLWVGEFCSGPKDIFLCNARRENFPLGKGFPNYQEVIVRPILFTPSEKWISLGTH